MIQFSSMMSALSECERNVPQDHFCPIKMSEAIVGISHGDAIGLHLWGISLQAN